MICTDTLLTMLWNIIEDPDLDYDKKIKELEEIKQTADSYIALCKDRKTNRKSNDEKC